MLISDEAAGALRKYGANAQMDQTIEECAELIVALRHYRRGKATEQDVLGELADVAIMVDQMTMHFGAQQFADVYREKLSKLRRRLEADQ